MTPMNLIAAIILLGLELWLIGATEEIDKMKVSGAVITAVGWIMNIVAIIMQHMPNG